MDKQTKDLMTQAIDEIRTLRRENEILSAKVDVMDLFAMVLHTTPAHRSQGASVDIAWQMQKAIDAEPVP